MKPKKKEMLTDLLFKATGLEKVIYFSASLVLLRGCWLETGESLLGAGTFNNIALLDSAIVKATGAPFARLDLMWLSELTVQKHCAIEIKKNVPGEKGMEKEPVRLVGCAVISTMIAVENPARTGLYTQY